MDPVTGLLTAGSLAAKIFSAIKGGRANDANQKLLDKRYIENETYYNNNANRDFLDTNVAKGIFEKLRKQSRENNQVVDSNAAATGATAEAVVAQKTANNEVYNDAVNNLAQGATQYQQQAEAIKRGTDASLDNLQMNINNNKAQSAANTSSNADNVMSSVADLFPKDYFKNRTKVLGGNY